MRFRSVEVMGIQSCTVRAPIVFCYNTAFNHLDQYPVGDLSGKLQMRSKDYPHKYLLPLTPSNELNGIYWDIFLPLQGIHSVVHRSITVERYNRTADEASPDVRTMIWACATITSYQENRHYQMPMTTAQVHFRYPIVAKILFRQSRDDPLHDTTVIIEYAKLFCGFSHSFQTIHFHFDHEN